MNKRLVKQLLYGAGYLFFFSLIFYGIYFFIIKQAPSCFDNRQNQSETGIDCGGSCQSCEIKTLSPIQVNWVKYFPTGDKIAVAAEIKNSNANYGADGFSYTLDIYGKNGGKIKSLTRKSFIYAAEIKYIVEPLEINPRDVSDIRISIADVGWKSKSEFERPKIQIREAKTAMAEDKIKIETSGFVLNNNAFLLSRLRIIGFLANKNGVKISVSKTELENLKAFEDFFFRIAFPQNVSLMTATASPLLNFNLADPNQTQIYVEAIR
ncbi:MAG: hypothetical protein UU85_C0001G0022 [Candidatus Wolfebacteria bacterium GW2011_GWA2_42_10]|uniref:Uncharacterized protein n=2 Tax=Candidatus Wolfeibacteriota TaxID=1752735 RepID=A0A0G0XMB7_9BACT|nr:MAG: hypothetical protein UU38_C0003G0089 [Candidatus Wolfebacteria bacterium GW2011_GWB1_41_12]KKS25592.1 MAG: hypothetical protein UU85_C0001G0022 [Candidatus Wolfebacteria bacterium GW2011_GWA2_42_10]KKT56517.1 MAG: hypothetical protein UW50_C0001G0084 [Candidatus Wolfebacteria bacterium GW2011_GWA1_44_24]